MRTKMKTMIGAAALLTSLAMVSVFGQTPTEGKMDHSTGTKMSHDETMAKIDKMSTDDKAAVITRMTAKDKKTEMDTSGHDVSKMSAQEKADMFDKMPMDKKMEMMKGGHMMHKGGKMGKMGHMDK